MANTKYKRLCCFKHTGIVFEHSLENITKDGSSLQVLASRCLNKDTSCDSLNCLYAGGKCDPFFDLQHAIHSDFLVYWTGKDIDDKYDSLWEQKNEPKLDKNIIDPYIDRLKSILRYGLWMTSSENDQQTFYKGKPIKRASFWRTCFTELKLSEARVHAKRFGRLGIGLKRPFVLGRRGSPIVYYREEFGNWFFEPFLPNAQGEIGIPVDAWWSYYLKSMNEGKTNSGYMQYKNFDESEWRIIYSPEIEAKLGVVSGIDKIEDKIDGNFRAYLDKYSVQKSKYPKYLLPLDKWFAFIIYPSLAVKVVAEKDDTLWKIITDEGIKADLPSDKSKWPNGSAGHETYSKPFGIDLDACKNF